MNNTQYFFKPREGKLYKKGLLEKKIFVLGASFFCNKSTCKNFEACTNEEQKDSSAFNNSCPEYTNENAHIEGDSLQDAPSIEIDAFIKTLSSKSYAAFSMFFEGFLAKHNYILKAGDTIWDHVCFTNYVQFILPHYQTYNWDIEPDRYNNALKSALIEFCPDIVICWGNVINTPLRSFDGCIDEEELYKSEYYRFHWKVNNKSFSFVNCDHPQSSEFILNYKKFEKYLDAAINE